MQNFILFYQLIRAAQISALPRSVEFDSLEMVNLALHNGQFGESRIGWTLDKEANEEPPSSMFAAVPNYDYFFLDAQGERVEEPGLEGRELIIDFEATLNWMVMNGYLYGEKGNYVVLDKCLRTLTPEVALSA
ncbi:hypothetical protein [Ewingella americana]|uniref:hypothetical protein n=1 Tax=Ewingella americana TaxID=41202 RepID=UPI00163A28DD|nr:hypothetical protein [Ewingella americana]QMV51284.1 hypothetical protein GXP68_07870 [Ewingella americana]